MSTTVKVITGIGVMGGAIARRLGSGSTLVVGRLQRRRPGLGGTGTDLLVDGGVVAAYRNGRVNVGQR